MKRRVLVFRILFGWVVFAFLSSDSLCQQAPLIDPAQTAVQPTEKNTALPVESKRLLGIIPNYRTSPSLQNYQPLTPSEKFKIASEDAFDRGTVILAGIFAAESQATNANRSFGQ